MWVFTKHGFISVVRTEDNNFMVRARRLRHLSALLPGVKVLETLDSDYRFRCILDEISFSHFMVRLQDTIDYPNFKDSLYDEDYKKAASQVWGTMYELQEGGGWSALYGNNNQVDIDELIEPHYDEEMEKDWGIDEETGRIG